MAENLGIQMHNSSYDAVNFGSLASNYTFDKVIGLEGKFIDWKDSLKIEEFVSI